MANKLSKDSSTAAASSNIFRTEVAAIQADLQAYCKKYAEVQQECEKLRKVRVSQNEDTGKELNLAKEQTAQLTTHLDEARQALQQTVDAKQKCEAALTSVRTELDEVTKRYTEQLDHARLMEVALKSSQDKCKQSEAARDLLAIEHQELDQKIVNASKEAATASAKLIVVERERDEALRALTEARSTVVELQQERVEQSESMPECASTGDHRAVVPLVPDTNKRKSTAVEISANGMDKRSNGYVRQTKPKIGSKPVTVMLSGFETTESSRIRAQMKSLQPLMTIKDGNAL